MKKQLADYSYPSPFYDDPNFTNSMFHIPREILCVTIAPQKTLQNKYQWQVQNNSMPMLLSGSIWLIIIP